MSVLCQYTLPECLPLYSQDQLASTELARIAGEFDEEGRETEGPGNKGDDLLAMMDEL